MEMHFLSTSYERHKPRTTTAHVLQRPSIWSRHPHSTYDAQFDARPRRLTACSVTSGHCIAQNAVRYNKGRQEYSSISPA